MRKTNKRQWNIPKNCKKIREKKRKGQERKEERGERKSKKTGIIS